MNPALAVELLAAFLISQIDQLSYQHTIPLSSLYTCLNFFKSVAKAQVININDGIVTKAPMDQYHSRDWNRT